MTSPRRDKTMHNRIWYLNYMRFLWGKARHKQAGWQRQMSLLVIADILRNHTFSLSELLWASGALTTYG